MNWIQQCKQEALKLSKEERQKILDDINNGDTIGEIRNRYGLTLAAVCGVVDMNIVNRLILNTESE